MIKRFINFPLIIAILTLTSQCTHPIMYTTFNGSWAERTLKHLTLREKIAQMMIYHMNMSFLNTESDKWQEIKSLIESDGIGGAHIYFGNPGISMTMMNEMQEMSKVPILFDGDIEYGMKFRFPGGTDIPPLMAIAATGDPKYAYLAAKITAIEATAVGIRWNFSPVVDVNNNPDNPIINTRAFGEDPDLVAEYGVQFIRGLQDHSMLATAKHFPGHGDTQTDSHTSLAEIPSDSARLWNIELKPFMKAIEVGVDAVMISHLQAPDFQPDPDTPATLSHFWITEVLREQLKFEGAVVTDAMGMGGITGNFTDTYALINSINAGCDIIILNESYKKAVDDVEEAVKRGIISEARIDAAALQMLKLKEKVGLHRQWELSEQTTRSRYGTQELALLAQQIATKAITLVKDEGFLIPLKPEENDTIFVVDVYSQEHNHSQSIVVQNLERLGYPVISRQVDETDNREYIYSIINEIADSAIVLFNTFSEPRARRDQIYLSSLQTELIRGSMSKTDRIIMTSFGNPYLIRDFPEISTYLCGYKRLPIMQSAMTDALLGVSPITGKLPVSIPNVAPAGTGILRGAEPIPVPEETDLTELRVRRAMPYEIGVDISQVQQLLNQAVADSAWPGGVLLAARNGLIFIQEEFGFHTYARERKTRETDIFDLASITKVIATTPAIMKLVEEEKLILDDKVVTYLPQFTGPDSANTHLKATVTIKQLITHTSGLPPFRQYYKLPGTITARLDSIYNTGLDNTPGATMVYSDIGLIILGKIVETVSGNPLDQFVTEELFIPLGMKNTFYNPPASKLKRIVPTEYSMEEGDFIHGHVHDENAYSLGGVAGHAGLFSTVSDLAVFSQMMLNKGRYGETVIFQEETVDLFTKRANLIPGNSRCLGWDSPAGKASGGVYLSSNSFGHTGFTGTSLWIDPDNRIFVILLTNAVHPDRNRKSPKYFDWRQRIHSAVYESLDFTEPNPLLEWRRQW